MQRHTRQLLNKQREDYTRYFTAEATAAFETLLGEALQEVKEVFMRQTLDNRSRHYDREMRERCGVGP